MNGRVIGAHRTSLCALGRAAGLLALLLLAGCQGAMGEQPRIEPYEPSDFFPQHLSARPIPDNAVPRQTEGQPEWVETGEIEGESVATIPAPLTEELLQRGQEQYEIFCAPCHGASGYGDGVVVQRGFTQPPSLHENRLRQAPAGYYFKVISEGVGTMYSYADRVEARDRWAIIAYIRALQLGQGVPVEQLPESDRQELGAPQP